MKKTLCVLLTALLLALSVSPALAEGASSLEPDLYCVTPIQSGVSCDLNDDGTAETIEYEVSNDDQGTQIPYVRLAVGEQEVRIDGWFMDEQLYLLRMRDLTYLLVFDYGPSDDPETHFYYLDESGALKDAGSIYTDPRQMEVKDEIITGDVRGSLLYTWYHPADFTIARSLLPEGPSRRVVSLPRPFYPMGLIVKAMRDIPLYAEPGSDEISLTLKEGDTAILSGSDDVKWIYVTDENNLQGGWIESAGEYKTDLIVNGQSLFGSEVFDGLLFAD